MDVRIEKDSFGEYHIPLKAYYGAHTCRALHNFSFGGSKVSGTFISAMAQVKKAAAQANGDLGDIAKDQVEAIVQACDEIAAGKFLSEFPLDALQGGAGTSTHMNMNEVIANRATEILGGKPGDYWVHPLDQVNKHQSTNDVYPTALKVAAIYGCRRLAEAVAGLQGVLQEKEKEFAGIVKCGRTEMQEAVPMTLGAEFSAWAEAISRDRWRTFKCEERLRVVNLGGTAIGTGLGAPRDYIFLVIEKLRVITGQGLSRGENMIGETANADVFVEVSGILKAHAVTLVKMSNDLRLLNLLGEIRLPPCQAGSSIMPGKVNPVIVEAVTQAGLKVMANDMLVAESASRAQLQINEFLPLLAEALLESLAILTSANNILSKHLKQVQADAVKCRYYFDRSRMIITALVPRLGYERCEAFLAAFDTAGKDNLREFLEAELGAELVNGILSPQALMSLGFRRK